LSSEARIRFSWNKTFATSSVKINIVNFDIRPIRSVLCNENLLLGSELVQFYDGENFAENTPHFAPELFSLEEQLATGSILEGDYSLRLIFLYEDANGNIHRTAPTALWGTADNPSNTDAFIRISAGVGSTIRVRYLLPPITHLRQAHGKHLRVMLYATETDKEEGPWYFAGDWPITPDIGTFGGLYPHPDLLGYFDWDGTDPFTVDHLKYHPTLYTEGGRLAAWPPPPAKDVAQTPYRLWIINAERPSEIWPSLITEQWMAPEFHPDLILTSPLGEAFTAIVAMDEKTIVFSETNIYIISGDGPDNTGSSGNFSGPTLLSTDTGCINKNSVISSKNGIAFEGKRGFYLLDRGLNVSYLGNTEQILRGELRSESGGSPSLWADLTINAAVAVPEYQEIRWSSATNTIIWDYERNAWSENAHVCDHAALINNVYTTGKNTESGWVIVEEKVPGDNTYDDATGAKDWMDITTAWIKPVGLLGYTRVWRFKLLGKHYSGDITVQIGYDYEETFTDTFTFSDASLEDSGEEFILTVVPSKQKSAAFRLRVYETKPPVGINQAGFSLSSISMEVGVKKGLFKQTPAGLQQ